MTNQKTLKHAILCAVLALILSISMLVGTTFAWFTDSVTSSGNVITTGTLDVTLEYTNTYADAAANKWIDASTNAIFTHDNWEPGYTEVKYVKIANEGTLAFKYQLSIFPNIQPVAGEPNLADVIDVYMVEMTSDTMNEITKDMVTAATPVGTLTDMIAENDGAAHGVILPAGSTAEEGSEEKVGEVVVAIALKMKKEADNQYQNLSVGGGFTVQLLATQYNEESDSFNNQYDADAPYDANQAIPVATVTINSSAVNNSELPWNSSHNAAPAGTTLDVAYTFVAPVDGDTASESPYASWLSDFAVSFDQNLEGGEVGLAGEYAGWDWIGFVINDELIQLATGDDTATELAAGTAVDLLGTAGITMDYEDLCLMVEEFNCGAWAEDEAAASGITMTVELRLYETYTEEECLELFGYKSANEKTGNYIVIGSYDYTFGS